MNQILLSQFEHLGESPVPGCKLGRFLQRRKRLGRTMRSHESQSRRVPKRRVVGRNLKARAQRRITHQRVEIWERTGVAVFCGGWAIEPLWLFRVAPIAGAIIGAAVYRFIGSDD